MEISRIIPGCLKLRSSQATISLEVFVTGAYYHIVWQSRRGRRLVPVECFEIIAHELLVKTGLWPARLVMIRRPEPGRVRSQRLVDQDGLAVENAELELRVGDDNTQARGTLSCLP